MNNTNKQLFKDQLIEIEEWHNNKFMFESVNFTRNELKELFDNHVTKEWLEYFYDSEPDYDDEEFKMFMDYNYMHKKIDTGGVSIFETLVKLEDIQEQKENFRYSEKEHTLEELEVAYNNINKQRKDYEDTRIRFNNWIELHNFNDGGWEKSQKQVEEFGMYVALSKLFDNYPKHRWAKAETDNEILVFFYGRDIKPKCDYLFVFDKEVK